MNPMGGCQLDRRFFRVQGATVQLTGGCMNAQSSFPRARAVWGASRGADPATSGRPLPINAKESSGGSVFDPFQPNKRMKLSCRGGHTCRNKFVFSVAAPSRSLCAIR